MDSLCVLMVNVLVREEDANCWFFIRWVKPKCVKLVFGAFQLGTHQLEVRKKTAWPGIITVRLCRATCVTAVPMN